jgi:hypothetical protein
LVTAAPAGTALTRDPRDEPVKLADHAMDAMRYALHGELGEAARKEAYLAAMQRRLEALRGGGRPHEDSGGAFWLA